MNARVFINSLNFPGWFGVTNSALNLDPKKCNYYALKHRTFGGTG